MKKTNLYILLGLLLYWGGNIWTISGEERSPVFNELFDQYINEWKTEIDRDGHGHKLPFNYYLVLRVIAEHDIIKEIHNLFPTDISFYKKNLRYNKMVILSSNKELVVINEDNKFKKKIDELKATRFLSKEKLFSEIEEFIKTESTFLNNLKVLSEQKVMVVKFGILSPHDCKNIHVPGAFYWRANPWGRIFFVSAPN